MLTRFGNTECNNYDRGVGDFMAKVPTSAANRYATNVYTNGGERLLIVYNRSYW